VRDVLSVEDELAEQQSGQIVFMSNGGFSGIQDRIVERLRAR
jgi:UDP-N-acetylmuramate-alanine ligase